VIALYITSIETLSGKTALCLGLARRLQSDGCQAGYFKPLGTLPYTLDDGRCCDEDALFAAQALHLAEPVELLSPVCLTQDLLEAQLAGPAQDMISIVTQAYSEVRGSKDIVILEGGASLREGYAVGLATPTVARMLGAPVLCIVKYRTPASLIDDALTAHTRLGDQLLGVVVNAVPPDGVCFAGEVGLPYLEKRRIAVLGLLPEEPGLRATSIGEIAAACEGQFLCGADKADELVENLVVGAMGVEQVRARMQAIFNKAVITGGDRADVVTVALEASAKVIILTGDLQPPPALLEQAAGLGVPIVLTSHHTLRAVELIERFFGKGRVAQPEKLARFEAVLAEHFDFARLYEKLGLAI
jgi:BioD-like phosphotransacetylase family protein